MDKFFDQKMTNSQSNKSDKKNVRNTSKPDAQVPGAKKLLSSQFEKGKKN